VFFGCEHVLIHNNFLSAAPGCIPRNGINSGPEGFTVSANITIVENRVTGGWDYPITTEGGRRCLITKNNVESQCITGIIERGEEITVSDNLVQVIPGKKDSCGINFYGVNNSLICKNVVSGGGAFGINCQPSHEFGGSQNITVDENTVEGSFACALWIKGSKHTHVRRNKFVTTIHDRNSAAFHAWYATDLMFESNLIQNDYGTGIMCTGSTNITICKNTLENTRASLL